MGGNSNPSAPFWRPGAFGASLALVAGALSPARLIRKLSGGVGTAESQLVTTVNDLLPTRRSALIPPSGPSRRFAKSSASTPTG